MMLTRRLAAAIGLMLAVVTSQLPEYVQQYRQRLGGAVDELKALVTEFDRDVAHQALDREGGLERLEHNPDELARARATSMRGVIGRETRLEAQERAFAEAGPVSQYAVLASGFDPTVGSRAFAAYNPAVPVTTAGIVAGLVGLFAGWAGTHLAAWPMRRPRSGDRRTPRTA